MLKAFLQRWRLKKTLKQNVSPEIARYLADVRLTEPGSPRFERDIEFAFIAIVAPDANSYSERVDAVAEIADKHRGFAHILLPIVVVEFGLLDAVRSGTRVPFVCDVQSRFPDAASIVHGSIIASCGLFAGTTCVFGFWWPGMLDAMRQLATLTPGQVHEIQPNQ